MTQQRSSDPGVRAKELWQIVLDLKWFVLLIGVAFSALGIVAIALWPDAYEATTTVMVDPQKIPGNYISATNGVDPAHFAILTDEVLSAPRLEQIVDELHLAPGATDRLSKDDFIAGLRKRIKITMKSGGEHGLGTFAITYKNGNRLGVAEVANRLAASFIEWSLAARERQGTETTEFLAAQLQEAKKALDEKAGQITAFEAQHPGELPGQLLANSQAVSHLQTALQANADALYRLDQEKVLLTQAPELIPSLWRTGVVPERTRLEDEQERLKSHLADLRTRYSEDYPDVQQARERLQEVEKELRGMAPATSPTASATSVRLAMVDREMERLQGEQKRLMEQIGGYQAKIDAAPLGEQQYAALAREHQDALDRYKGLLDKTNAARLATNLEREQAAGVFTILDPATVPQKPTSPRRLPFFVLLIPCCFLLAASSVIFFERMRGTMGTERELRLILPGDAPILGRIPVIDTPAHAQRQYQLAMFSVTASLACCLAVAVFLWRVHPHL